jgi:parallel beta-helix repeat protein
LVTGSASAATLYVAPGGSMIGGCASSEPCAASRANAIVAPGDIVAVAPGSYDVLVLTRGGTSGAPVRWVSAVRWAAHAPRAYIAASAPFVTFEGFDVGGGAATLIRVEASYSRIVGNHVHGSTSACTSGGGIVIGGYQNGGYNGVGGEVLGNLVEDIGAGPRDGSCRTFHGIYSEIPQVRIVNNVERRALGYGIHLWHGARDNSIVNNTVTDNGAGGILVGAGDDGATGLTPIVTGNFVANNIVAANRDYGISECCDSSLRGPNRYVSNLGWRNGAGNSASGLIGNIRGGGAMSGSSYADPRFVSTDDDHLQARSPAIDSGTGIGAPATDFDGVTRPQAAGIDRGAYEYAVAPVGQPAQPPVSTRGPSSDQRRIGVARFHLAPRRVRMSRRGTVRLRVGCPRPEQRCRVQLRLLRQRVTLAAGTLSVRGGDVRPVTLKLTRDARRALVRARSLRVTAAAVVRTRAGHRGTTRISVLLLAPSRAERKHQPQRSGRGARAGR